MFNVRQPFFNLDGADGGWNDFFTAETPAGDEQPDADSDAEELEDGQQSETAAGEAEEDVSDDADEADEEEDGPDAEKGDADDQPLDDNTEIDLGEGRQPVKLSELKQGYLRQSDYTKKTQVLAEERKTFEAERDQMAPIKQMSEFLNVNPYLREQIQQFIAEFTSTGQIPLQEALQDAAYGQYINTLMAQNQQLTQKLQEIEGKYGDLSFGTEMDKAIGELRGEYGELITPEYEQQLRDQAKSENLRPDMLKRIAKGDLAEMKLKQSKKSAKEIEAETIQNIQEKRKSLPPQPRSKGQKPSSSKPVEDMSWGDLLRG